MIIYLKNRCFLNSTGILTKGTSPNTLRRGICPICARKCAIFCYTPFPLIHSTQEHAVQRFSLQDVQNRREIFIIGRFVRSTNNSYSVSRLSSSYSSNSMCLISKLAILTFRAYCKSLNSNQA